MARRYIPHISPNIKHRGLSDLTAVSTSRQAIAATVPNDNIEYVHDGFDVYT